MTEWLFDELLAIFERACNEWDACQAAYLQGDMDAFRQHKDAHTDLAVLYRATKERRGATIN